MLVLEVEVEEEDMEWGLVLVWCVWCVLCVVFVCWAVCVLRVLQG